MCGRYVAATPALVVAEHFGVDEVRVDDVDPSWNVAPTDRVPAVAEHAGRRLLGAFRWGLVPAWARDTKAAARHINARAETVAERPAFRRAFAARRCIVPADGFYEWRLAPGGLKQPLFISAADGAPLGFAGLWEVWRDRADRDAAPLKTCTIITVAANDTLSAVHDRMPAILPPDAWATWLDPGEDDPGLLGSLLRPAAPELLTMRPVSTRVNDVRNNGDELLAPVPG